MGGVRIIVQKNLLRNFVYLSLKYLIIIFLGYISLNLIIDIKYTTFLIRKLTENPYTYLFGITFGLYKIFFGKDNLFWEVFFHELAHAIMIILTCNNIKGFVAYKNSGITQFTGHRNWLIDLAPYTIPIPTIFFLIISLFVTPDFLPYFNVVTAISFGIYIGMVTKQFSIYQPDIKSAGYQFSLFVVITSNVLFAVFLLFYLNGEIFYLNEVLKQNIFQR